MNGTLYKRFNSALIWNAFSFAAYKILFIAQTISLYAVMPPSFFSQWATTTSIMYLVLLWADFGFKKSIPRFMPLFSRSRSAQRRFIRIVLLAKLLTLIIAIIPTTWYLKYGTHISTPLLWRVLILFMLQGILSVIEIVFHAHFWNKQFNLPTTCITGVGIGIVCLTIPLTPGASLLINLFTINIITTCVSLGATLFILKRLLAAQKEENTASITPARETIIMHVYLKHTLVMGVITFLQSLTERNFLLPFFTHTLGISVGNIFKVSNDMALFVYRSVVKTLGTADTALLAHINEQVGTESSLESASKKLMAQVAALLFPVLGITILCVYMFKSQSTSFVFQLFIIMVLGYSLEMICIPYERVLEVYRQYRSIMYAYVPYVLGIVSLFFILRHVVPPFGIILVCIHGVRLVSGGVMVVCARARYRISVPWKRILYSGLLTLLALSIMGVLIFFYRMLSL